MQTNRKSTTQRPLPSFDGSVSETAFFFHFLTNLWVNLLKRRNAMAPEVTRERHRGPPQSEDVDLQGNL